MNVDEIAHQATRTIGGFDPIAYPPVGPAGWSYGREDVVSFPAGARHAWAFAVRARITELIRLPENWDPRGSRSLNVEDVRDALAFLASAMNPSSPIPGIVALASGGLELHWRVGAEDLEVVFDRSEGERVALLDVGDDEHELTPEDAVGCVTFLGTPQAVAA
jgi:hypothetical protein